MNSCAPETADAQRADTTTYWIKSAPVMKAIAHMAIPMMLGMMAMSVYNFTDTLFIGMLDDTAALAAPALCMPVVSLMLAISMFFEVGAASEVARSIGIGDRRQARSVSAFAIWGAVCAGLVLAVALFALMDPLLALLGAQSETAGPTRSYLSVFCFGAPFAILNMVGAQLVRAVAKSKEASAGVAGSALLNIVLDPIFIFSCGMGVAGAALATVISNGAAALYYLLIIRKSKALAISPQAISLQQFPLRAVAKTGVSALLLAVLMGVTSLIFNNVAMQFGAAAVAGFGISQSVVQLLEMVTMGLYEGVMPLMAGAWGANNRGRLREVVAKTGLCLAAFCAVACVVAIVFAPGIVGLFSHDSDVLAVGALILMAQILAVPFASGSGLTMSLLQACDKGIFATALSVVKGFACVPCVLAGAALFGVAGVAGSLLAYEAIAFLIGLALSAATFRRPDASTLPQSSGLAEAAK